MQTKQIKADGVTEYAYASNYDWTTISRYGDRERNARRVVVTATGQPRRVWSGYNFRTNNDGIAISFIGDDGRPTGKTEVVRSADIRALWADYVSERDEQRKVIEERTARRAAEQATRKARLDEIFAMIPYAKRPYWADGSMSGKLTSEELAELLEVAYAAGVNGGKSEYHRALAKGATS